MNYAPQYLHLRERQMKGPYNANELAAPAQPPARKATCCLTSTWVLGQVWALLTTL